MSKGTIIRTAVLLYALINQVLVLSGLSALPFAEGDVELVITGILTVVASLVAWWKNNSVTKEAQEADEYLKKLKGEK